MLRRRGSKIAGEIDHEFVMKNNSRRISGGT